MPHEERPVDREFLQGSGVRDKPRGAVYRRAAARRVVEEEALRLVSEGFTQAEVAVRQGVRRETVTHRVAAALSRLPSVDADLYRRRMVDELQRVKAAAWGIVDDPPFLVSAGRVTEVRDASAVTGALGALVKALEREARLVGVDAPSRQTVQVIDNRALDEEIARLRAELNTVDAAVPSASRVIEP